MQKPKNHMTETVTESNNEKKTPLATTTAPN